MIKKEEVYKIGLFNKPHGIHGELQFTFTDDIFDRVDCDYLICLLDGIFVPFFIEEYRFRSDSTALVKLEGIETAERARMFTNVEVYFPVKHAEEAEDGELSWNFFVGFRMEDVRHGELGEVVEVDTATVNTLFVVEQEDGEELLIPAQGEYSEIQDAKDFAESIHMKNDAKVITPDEYWDSLSDIQYYMDEPVADPAAVALYFLSKEAAKKVKVALSGEGSDELFGGYNIYCEPLEHTAFNKIPMPIRRFMGKFAEYCLPRGMKGRGFLMRHGKTLEERYFANATNIFTEREAAKILKKGCRPEIQDVTKPLYNRVKDKDAVTKMQYVDLHLWLVHDILMKGDKMGMANSLEVRVPFLDRNVLELAESLPLQYKVQAPRTKVALRAAAERSIRNKTAEKKKLGFPIPIRVWLKEEKYYNRVRAMFASSMAKKFFNTDLLMKMLEDHRDGKNTNEKTDDSRKIWTVYIFLVWYDRFFEHGKPVHPSMTAGK